MERKREGRWRYENESIKKIGVFGEKKVFFYDACVRSFLVNGVGVGLFDRWKGTRS